VSRQDEGAPIFQGVGVIGLGLIERLVFFGRFSEFLVLGELGNEGESKSRREGGVDGLVEPGVGLGRAPHAGEMRPSRTRASDVVWCFSSSIVRSTDEPALHHFRRKTSFKSPSDFAMEPAIGPELGRQTSEVMEKHPADIAEPTDLSALRQLGGDAGPWLEGVSGLFRREGLEAREGGSGLVFGSARVWAICSWTGGESRRGKSISRRFPAPGGPCSFF